MIFTDKVCANDDDDDNIFSFTEIEFVIYVTACSRIRAKRVIVFNLDKRIVISIKPEISLLFQLQSATCPYPKPD